MAKGNKGFGSLLTESIDDDIEEGEAAPARSIMASRSEALNRLASGKVVTDRTEFVDPARCRPWRLHNRDLDHLSEESCRDLIDAFLSAKKQRIPAIVRRLRDDPEHDYEVVYLFKANDTWRAASCYQNANIPHRAIHTQARLAREHLPPRDPLGSL